MTEHTTDVALVDPLPPVRRRAAAVKRLRLEERRGAFLEALAKYGVVKHACEASGMSRKTVYDWRSRDEEFAEQWREALESACDTLEEAARERAISRSDTLIMFLLRAYRPQVFGERRRIDVTATHKLEISDGDLMERAKEIIDAEYTFLPEEAVSGQQLADSDKPLVISSVNPDT